jgi:NAD(P)-dependent dehydrogenase (short-subunit alcohol dehydrogenase family)
MAGLLTKKVAFVTGGAAGLGLGIVKGFAAAGARGLAFDLSPPSRPLPKGWEFFKGDVRTEADLGEALGRTMAKFGRLDVLVANAGVVPPWRDSDAIDLQEWDDVFAVNVRGVIASIKLAIPLMKASGGSILVMASVNARFGHARQTAYVASKHAVLGIARATALDVGRFGIRVNALCPGPVATTALLERVRQRMEAGGVSGKEMLRQYSKTALGRIPTVGDVAGAAVFLASELSSGVSGQAIVVDAGAR